MSIGSFTFVLHSHIPYTRLAGRWPHGEEWIHEAITETYIPLLKTLYQLKEKGHPIRLTLGLTPILAEQLADPDILSHFEQYIQSRIDAAHADTLYYRDFLVDDPTTIYDPHLHYLATWHKESLQAVQTAFHEQFQRDIIGAFRQLQNEGFIEIIGGPATHPYLPLLSQDSSIEGQLVTGINSYRRLFGRDPKAVWLPECAYRPAYHTEANQLRPGIEHFLAKHGIKLFFSETHTITGGQPVGLAAGEALGPYGAVTRRYTLPASESLPTKQATTFFPYYVNDSTHGADATTHSGVAVIGRNNSSSMQVWSAETGYPGDFDYREFHKRAGTSGLQYWRVTGNQVGLEMKDYYQPEWAAYKIDQHAEHFAHLVGDILRKFHNKTGEHGLVASCYDTELFGHWWFEGVEWLGKVLEHLAENEDISLTTATQFIEEHPPKDTLNIPESSWGAGGTHFTWDNPETHWMWEPIHQAEKRVAAFAKSYPEATPEEAAVLNQVVRELMLMQSSDWPFLVTTGQAREYAIQRFNQHYERFSKLADSLDQGAPDSRLAAEYWELDKVFPDVDYRAFAPLTTG